MYHMKYVYQKAPYYLSLIKTGKEIPLNPKRFYLVFFLYILSPSPNLRYTIPGIKYKNMSVYYIFHTVDSFRRGFADSFFRINYFQSPFRPHFLPVSETPKYSFSYAWNRITKVLKYTHDLFIT